LAHSTIDVISDHSLAYRYGVLDAVALTDVLRHEAILTGVVSDCHPTPADSTDYQALQQSGALAWRTFATVGSDSLRVFAEAQKVLFILLPGDVAGVSILDEHPLLSRQLGVGGASMRVVASAAPAIYECARIARVVQDVQRPAVCKLCPH
jgi:hypothetical protein